MTLYAAVPVLSVNDLEGALDYYQRVLGFQKNWIWGDPPELVSVCRDRVELKLAQRGKLGPAGASQLYIQLDGIDRIWEELRRSGATIAVAIADRVYGMRDFSVRDESGNRIDLGEPTESARAPRPAANDLEVFVPARDFAVSKRFHAALGFHANWEEGDLAEFEIAGVRFLLQNLRPRAGTTRARRSRARARSRGASASRTSGIRPACCFILPSRWRARCERLPAARRSPACPPPLRSYSCGSPSPAPTSASPACASSRSCAAGSVTPPSSASTRWSRSRSSCR